MAEEGCRGHVSVWPVAIAGNGWALQSSRSQEANHGPLETVLASGDSSCLPREACTQGCGVSSLVPLGHRVDAGVPPANSHRVALWGLSAAFFCKSVPINMGERLCLSQR